MNTLIDCIKFKKLICSNEDVERRAVDFYDLYRFLQQYWGRCYGTEAAQALACSEFTVLEHV